MIEYKPNDIEKKWRDKWNANGEHTIDLDSSKPKYYCLDMFPYPSGEGLHVGHWRGYVLSDVLSRYKKLQGFNVLHPMGWDSFGLPAENAAIKKNIHPKINTKKNIDNMKRQLSEIGAMYDWSKEINTSTPEYYKWTQWIFLQMYKKGLAYKKEMPINWCKSCKTCLANEEVVNGLCERCGSDVVKKPMSQWMLKITDYAERLLKDLDDLNWPNKVKTMQKNWIGKSEGATIKFKVLSENNESYSLDVFTNENNNNLNFSKNTIEKYIILLSPFAPHICEELWETLGNKNSIFTKSYPVCEDKYLHSDESVIVIQINGKSKGKTTVNKGSDQNTVETQIYKTEQIKNFIKDKKIKKVVFVKDKLINIVVNVK